MGDLTNRNSNSSSVWVNRTARAFACSHPFLFAILPILILFSQNQDEAPLGIVLLWLAVTTVLTTMLLGLAQWLVGNLLKATLLVSAFNLLFFTYGRAFDFLMTLKWPILSQTTWHRIELLTSLSILVAVFSYLRTTRRDLLPLSKFLSGVLCILAIFTSAKILGVVREASTLQFLKQQECEHAKYQPITPQETDSPDKPDIYYIILDAYARHDVLKNVYNHVNEPFLESLRSHGFYVADKSCSNYPFTFMSLPSSLNMQYFDEEFKPKGGIPDRWVFRKYCHRPLISRILQSKGYRFIQTATNVGLTETSDYADELKCYYPSWLQREFSQVLLRTTPLRLFEPNIAYMHLNTFAELAKVPEIPGPKFTFAHIICPHRPFVFGCDGTILDDQPQDLVVQNERYSAARSAYANQVAFINKLVIDTVDQIVAKSKSPPIIIVHGDHGTSLLTNRGKYRKVKNFDVLAQERLPILNAYLVPDKMREKLYPNISPVNTFRLLLSECFGEDFPLLPDRSYIGWYNKPFDLTDATEFVAHGAPSLQVVKAMSKRAKKKLN